MSIYTWYERRMTDALLKLKFQNFHAKGCDNWVVLLWKWWDIGYVGDLNSAYSIGKFIVDEKCNLKKMKLIAGTWKKEEGVTMLRLKSQQIMCLRYYLLVRIGYHIALIFVFSACSFLVSVLSIHGERKKFFYVAFFVVGVVLAETWALISLIENLSIVFEPIMTMRPDVLFSVSIARLRCFMLKKD